MFLNEFRREHMRLSLFSDRHENDPICHPKLRSELRRQSVGWFHRYLIDASTNSTNTEIFTTGLCF